MNEPSGARLFSGFWVEIGQCAHDHGAQFELRRANPFSAVNRGARTGLKHRAWRSSCSACHTVERDMFSELCRRSTLRVCRGVSVTATSISARSSLDRRLFSGRDWSGAPPLSCLIFVLVVSSDQSGRNARTSNRSNTSSDGRSSSNNTAAAEAVTQNREKKTTTTHDKEETTTTETTEDHGEKKRREEARRGEERERGGEEEGRVRGQIMKIMCLKNT